MGAARAERRGATSGCGVGLVRIDLVTIAAGRHDHLTAQLQGVRRSTVAPHRHVVVAMGDSGIDAVVRDAGATATVVHVEAGGSTLPIAHARNVGAQSALDDGADLIVFLDVDCIPGTNMFGRYRSAAGELGDARTLLCGPVTYLPPQPSPWTEDDLVRHTAPHAARPDPPDGTVMESSNFDLFWSLSFAVTPRTWRSIGGFYEGYLGYGGEDTDFASAAREAGAGLHWVGGAHSYHQHHAVSSPPVEHLDDIVRNAAIFHRRWNRWPMEGWLDEFERRGLVRRSAGGTIEVCGQADG